MSKKFLVLILICSGVFLCSCSLMSKLAAVAKPGSSMNESTPENANVTKDVNAAEDTKTGTTIQESAPEDAIAPEDANAPEDSKQNTGTEEPDSGLTLEKLKAKAEKLGYEVLKIEEYQLTGIAPKPVNGFNVHYSDENSDAYIPVLEFASPDDALKYAGDVNKSGYSLSIVNGRFLTAVSAEYGVVRNDAEAAFLTGLLESEVMAVPKESTSPVISAAGDYGSAAEQAGSLTKALNTLVNNTVLTHDKSAAEDKNFSAAFISFNMITSGNLSFTSYLSEDEEDRNMLAQIWTGFGVTDMKVERTAAHTYELTGARAGVPAPFLIRCAFDPSSGSLRLLETDGDRVVELFEFVPLGGDTYAFQTISERAVVTYRDGKITAFAYSLLKSGTDGYDPDADGIYAKTGLNGEWVMAAGEDSFSQLVTYNGTVLKIDAESFFTGKRVSAEISVF